jgi:hypothetical protein
MIGLEPDRSWERGDPIGRSGRAYQPFSGWQIGVGSNHGSPEQLVERVLARAEVVSEEIRRCASDPRVHSVALWLWSSGDTFALELTPRLLKRIEHLALSLKIDVYDAQASEPRGLPSPFH